MLDVQTRRRNMRLLSETGAGESDIKQFLPNGDVAIRQYYHSRSNEPMLKGAWDVDSDDEEDEEWLTKMSEEVCVRKVLMIFILLLLVYDSPSCYVAPGRV
jgi:hypothetical protein